MSRLRRCLNWVVFLGFLAAVATIVFLYVRRSPRCVIAEPAKDAVTVLLAPDGTRLMAMPGSLFARGGPGPWRLWDTRSGQLLDELFGADGVGWFEISSDRRHLAAYVADGNNSIYGNLWLVDWLTGEKHQLDVQRVHALGFKFSSTGRWLFVATNTPGPVASRGILAQRTVVVDVATKRIVLSLQWTFPKSSNDDRRLLVHDWPDKGTAVWDLESGNKLADLTPAEFPNEADFVTSPDDRVFLSWQSWKREVDMWDLTSLTKRFRKELGLAPK